MKTTPQPATQPATLKVSDYALIHDIPEWAIPSLEYGEGEEDMVDEDLKILEEWEKTTTLFPRWKTSWKHISPARPPLACPVTV